MLLRSLNTVYMLWVKWISKKKGWYRSDKSMRSMNFDHLKLPCCEFQNYEVMAMSVVGGQPKTNANPIYMYRAVLK